MRTRVSSSTIAVGAVFVLLVALVTPAGAAPPNNPFVGSWESVYLDESNEIGELLGERNLRFQIGGGGHIHGTANPTGICYGQYEEFMRSSSLGWGTIISEDPYIFEGYVDVYCHTERGRHLAFEDFRVEYQYDPDTDTLQALHYPETAQFNCLWRSGSDPSVCPPSLILPPSRVEGANVAAAGQVLADALYEATGVTFSVVAAASHRDVYNRMCAFPATSVGITSTLTYSLASVDCGVDASFRAVRFGSDGWWTQFLVPAGSEFEGIDDLDGKTWAHPDVDSTSGYIVPVGMMVLAGVEPSASLNVGNHVETVLAVYNSDAEFGTTFFDARTRVEDEYPNIFDVVDILDISPIIPNDAVSFGSQFPEDLRLQIETALLELADPVGEVWDDSIGRLYGWEGINRAADDDWDWLRTVLEATEFSIDDQ